MDKLDTASTGVLVIDMQNGFCHDRGALAQAGVDMSRQKAIIPRVKQLVQLARREDSPFSYPSKNTIRKMPRASAIASRRTWRSETSFLVSREPGTKKLSRN